MPDTATEREVPFSAPFVLLKTLTPFEYAGTGLFLPQVQKRRSAEEQ